MKRRFNRRSIRGMTLAETLVALAVTSMIIAAATGSLQLVTKIRQRKTFERSIAAQAESLLMTFRNDISHGSRVSLIGEAISFKGLSTHQPEEVLKKGQPVILQPEWSLDEKLSPEMRIVAYEWDPAHRRLRRIEIPRIADGVSFIEVRKDILSEDVTDFSLEWDKRLPESLVTGLHVRFTITRGPFNKKFNAYLVFRNPGLV